ncbi:hypothetical protein L6164_001529 [Bauhinia variegata]|uniref:Uncharacterized protein n=1 Tax=Bauhinia variegata TaxID=167791 RepID=A0ACB9Q9Z1_BAUVA|nr:hypothetical protein L6164_001529 [Bauhinia variegata]
MYPPNPDTSDQKHHGAPTPYTQLPATGVQVSSTTQHSSNYPPPPPAAPVAWSTGLFDCCSDVKNCCITCWCPCITFGQIAEIVDRGSTSSVTSGTLYGLISLITGCACIYSYVYRTKIREQYMLEESPCGDCMVHCFCDSCAMCQEYRELQNRGYNMTLGWKGNVQQQNHGVAMTPTAPTSEPGMTR